MTLIVPFLLLGIGVDDIFVIVQVGAKAQGDTEDWQKPFSLKFGMFRHFAWAEGSYSGGPPAAGTARIKSTGGFYRSFVSPCGCHTLEDYVLQMTSSTFSGLSLLLRPNLNHQS